MSENVPFTKSGRWLLKYAEKLEKKAFNRGWRDAIKAYKKGSKNHDRQR